MNFFKCTKNAMISYYIMHLIIISIIFCLHAAISHIVEGRQREPSVKTMRFCKIALPFSPNSEDIAC